MQNAGGFQEGCEVWFFITFPHGSKDTELSNAEVVLAAHNEARCCEQESPERRYASLPYHITIIDMAIPLTRANRLLRCDKCWFLSAEDS